MIDCCIDTIFSSLRVKKVVIITCLQGIGPGPTQTGLYSHR